MGIVLKPLKVSKLISFEEKYYNEESPKWIDLLKEKLLNYEEFDNSFLRKAGVIRAVLVWKINNVYQIVENITFDSDSETLYVYTKDNEFEIALTGKKGLCNILLNGKPVLDSPVSFVDTEIIPGLGIDRDALNMLNERHAAFQRDNANRHINSWNEAGKHYVKK